MRNATRPLPAGEQVTMLEAGEELCRRLEIRGRKKSNRLTVASDLRNHIVPFLGDRELDRIEPKDVERYIAVKLGTLAPMAAAKIMISLKRRPCIRAAY
jgi:hypothetical protein